MSISFKKQAVEVKDYTVDWTAWLPTGDTVASCTVAASPSGLTLGTKTVSSPTVTQLISSGTATTTYTITYTMTTANGLVDQRVIYLVVVDVPAQ